VSAPGLRPLAAAERRQAAGVAERLAGLLDAADLDDPDETAFTVGWTIGTLRRLAEALGDGLDDDPVAERLAELAADLPPDGGGDR